MQKIALAAALACLSVVAVRIAAAAPPSPVTALGALPELLDFTAGRASSHDVTGGNGDSWSFDPGQMREIANIEGPGAITHLWFTMGAREPGFLRKVVIRMYWDDEKEPSVECPIGDFFGLGHGQYYRYSCAPIQIGDYGGLNCYWRMPFAKRARVTLTNECDSGFGIYFYVDYVTYKPRAVDFGKLGYFHAQYRQGRPPDMDEDYTILDAKGRGSYVGCNYTIQLSQIGWWGEGDDKFYIDGDTKPTIWGTGSEDYFGGAWGFPNTDYANLYIGVPLNGFFQTGAITNCYRYHIEDPVPFTKSVRLDIEHRGEGVDAAGQRTGFVVRPDYIASVAYWYQTEPHAPFAALPSVNDRLIEEQRDVFVEPDSADVEQYLNFVKITGAPAEILKIEKMHHYPGARWSRGEQALVDAAEPGVELHIPTAAVPGITEMAVFYTKGPDYGTFSVLYGDEVLLDSVDAYAQQVTRSDPLVVKFPRPVG
ncbi:MAG: DUF2961 domain-containing protein, partial [Armatimonadota bacterium]